MNVQLQLSLPRESRFVPMLRATASRFLTDLGVPEEDIEDIEVILTEACANVVRHAVDTSEYSVEVAVSNTGCTIAVKDEGPGFDLDGSGFDPEGPGFDLDDVDASSAMAESGRGLALIRALADDVSVQRIEGQHLVLLEKIWYDPPARTGTS